MITSDLLEYIKSQLNKNISKDSIILKLTQVGWEAKDIAEGFSKIEESLQSPKIQSNFTSVNVGFSPEVKKEETVVSSQNTVKTFDPYRELPDGIDIEEVSVYNALAKKEETPFVSVLENMSPIKIVAPEPEKPAVEEFKPVVENKVIEEPETSAEIPFVSVLDKMEPIKIPINNEELQSSVVVEPEESIQQSEEISKKEETPFVSALASMAPLDIPITHKDIPVVEEIKPVEVSITPTEEEVKPAEPAMPVVEEIKPTEISIPSAEEEIKSIDEIKPTIEEVKPVIEDSNPVLEEVVPVEEKPIMPAVENVTPVKIWVPQAVKPVENIKREEPIVFSRETEIEPYMIEVEQPKKEEANNIFVDKNSFKEENKIEESSAPELMPVLNKVATSPSKIESVISEPVYNSIQNVKPVAENTPQSFSVAPLKIQDMSIPVYQNTNQSVAKKSAIISSYTQDILSAEKEEEKAPVKKKNIFLKFGIAIFVISLISGMIFAFVEGSLRIPGLNLKFSVVKKDPRTVLIETPGNLSDLKSYKVDTSISISTPSLSNITTGLTSGDVVTSKDRDSATITSKGLVKHSGSKTIFDYILSFKSSLLKEDINSELKYDGKKLFASVPDLNQILHDDAPNPMVVSFKPDEIGDIIPEFSSSVQESIKEFDIYNILSGEVSPYVKKETALILKDFISKLEYSEKGIEVIRGVETYHYELTAGRQNTKQLLTSLVDLFVVNLTSEQKKNLDEALGSSTISSFDVWIGKNDDNLYQTKFTINTPLSRVLSLNDSGIAGNEVKLDWTTSYYDFDVENNISIPESKVGMKDLINNIRDVKIKNIISTFRPNATYFKNAIGSYGQRLNPSGSCTNPNPGSLFSPQGHTKGAVSSIAAISSSMNDLLLATNGAGSCYSTSKEWSLVAPLYTLSESSSPQFFCTDSKGNTSTLSSPVTGPVCE